MKGRIQFIVFQLFYLFLLNHVFYYILDVYLIFDKDDIKFRCLKCLYLYQIDFNLKLSNVAL